MTDFHTMLGEAVALVAEARGGEWRSHDAPRGYITTITAGDDPVAFANNESDGVTQQNLDAQAIAAAVNLLKQHGPALVAAVDGWRPIEEAPRDGEVMCMVRILLGHHTRPDEPPSEKLVPAFRVNEFFAVHAEIEEGVESKATTLTGDYVATHLPSGFTAITSPSLETCIQAAKAMAELPVDWANLRKEDVRNLPDDVKTQVKVIRAAASADAEIYTQDDIDAAMTPPAGRD